jgi:hypothetical protein
VIYLLKVDILTKAEEATYEDFLNKCKFSSIQHSLDWRNVICDLKKDEPFFIVAKENNEIVGALPLYYYKCKFGNLLTTAAWYTISGIIYSKEGHRQEIYKALLDHSINLAKELDCTAISIGTSPFLKDKELHLKYFKPDYVLENFVQAIKLSKVFNEKGNVMHPNYLKRGDITRNLKKARRQPITISEEQTQNNVDKWFRIHEKRMGELNATPIPRELFSSILNNMVPKEKGKFLFAFYKDRMIFGSVFLFNKNKINAFMISSDSDYAKFGVNYLAANHMLRFAKKNNISFFDWMSSPKKGDGLYKWKQKWGSHERSFLYLTKILGDISHWKSMDLDKLKEAYAFHYLLPFNLLKNKHVKSTNKSEVTSFMRSLSKK